MSPDITTFLRQKMDAAFEIVSDLKQMVDDQTVLQAGQCQKDCAIFKQAADELHACVDKKDAGSCNFTPTSAAIISRAVGNIQTRDRLAIHHKIVAAWVLKFGTTLPVELTEASQKLKLAAENGSLEVALAQVAQNLRKLQGVDASSGMPLSELAASAMARVLRDRRSYMAVAAKIEKLPNSGAISDGTAIAVSGMAKDPITLVVSLAAAQRIGQATAGAATSLVKRAAQKVDGTALSGLWKTFKFVAEVVGFKKTNDLLAENEGSAKEYAGTVTFFAIVEGFGTFGKTFASLFPRTTGGVVAANLAGHIISVGGLMTADRSEVAMGLKDQSCTGFIDCLTYAAGLHGIMRAVTAGEVPAYGSTRKAVSEAVQALKPSDAICESAGSGRNFTPDGWAMSEADESGKGGAIADGPARLAETIGQLARERDELRSAAEREVTKPNNAESRTVLEDMEDAIKILETEPDRAADAMTLLKRSEATIKVLQARLDSFSEALEELFKEDPSAKDAEGVAGLRGFRHAMSGPLRRLLGFLSFATSEDSVAEKIGLIQKAVDLKLGVPQNYSQLEDSGHMYGVTVVTTQAFKNMNGGSNFQPWLRVHLDNLIKNSREHGGAKTIIFDYDVNADAITVTNDGRPLNAKELKRIGRQEMPRGRKGRGEGCFDFANETRELGGSFRVTDERDAGGQLRPVFRIELGGGQELADVLDSYGPALDGGSSEALDILAIHGMEFSKGKRPSDAEINEEFVNRGWRGFAGSFMAAIGNRTMVLIGMGDEGAELDQAAQEDYTSSMHTITTLLAPFRNKPRARRMLWNSLPESHREGLRKSLLYLMDVLEMHQEWRDVVN